VSHTSAVIGALEYALHTIAAEGQDQRQRRARAAVGAAA